MEIVLHQYKTHLVKCKLIGKLIKVPQSQFRIFNRQDSITYDMVTLYSYGKESKRI